jgi:hypothetical protein
MFSLSANDRNFEIHIQSSIPVYPGQEAINLAEDFPTSERYWWWAACRQTPGNVGGGLTVLSCHRQRKRRNARNFRGSLMIRRAKKDNLLRQKRDKAISTTT